MDDDRSVNDVVGTAAVQIAGLGEHMLPETGRLFVSVIVPDEDPATGHVGASTIGYHLDAIPASAARDAAIHLAGDLLAHARDRLAGVGLNLHFEIRAQRTEYSRARTPTPEAQAVSPAAGEGLAGRRDRHNSGAENERRPMGQSAERPALLGLRSQRSPITSRVSSAGRVRGLCSRASGVNPRCLRSALVRLPPRAGR